MVEPNASDRTNPNKNKPSLTPEKYARLKAEAEAPYRGLRQFVYLACGASGFIGAFVFLAQLAAGNEVETALPNFALQIGVVALMVWLFRLEQRASNKKKKS
jgi:Low psii accumulation1 / Rep27